MHVYHMRRFLESLTQPETNTVDVVLDYNATIFQVSALF